MVITSLFRYLFGFDARVFDWGSYDAFPCATFPNPPMFTSTKMPEGNNLHERAPIFILRCPPSNFHHELRRSCWPHRCPSGRTAPSSLMSSRTLTNPHIRSFSAGRNKFKASSCLRTYDKVILRPSYWPESNRRKSTITRARQRCSDCLLASHVHFSCKGIRITPGDLRAVGRFLFLQAPIMKPNYPSCWGARRCQGSLRHERSAALETPLALLTRNKLTTTTHFG